jgi:cell wall-associated NlpC family hydrolase
MNAVQKICTLWRAASMGMLAVALVVPLAAGSTTRVEPTARTSSATAEIALLDARSAALVTEAATPRRHLAMKWARTQAGKSYCSPGGNSGTRVRSCYDCSGLVGTAYRKAGIPISGGTANFLSSGKLQRVSKSQVHWGDLAFFGSGHVELWGHWTNSARTRGVTFGAHNSRMSIDYRSFNSAYYGPTAFYHVVGAG